MHNKTNTQHLPQVWVFWVGVLTGALAIGLIFTYQAINNQSLENAILKTMQLQTTQSNTLTGPSMDSITGPGM